MRLRTKIIILTLLASFFPYVIIGILGYRTASLSLRKQAFSQLVSIREMKKKQIEDYFSVIRNQIQTFSEDKMIIDAMKEFKVAFNEFLNPNSTSAFQLEEYRDSLRSYYTEDFANEYKKRNNGRSPDSENFLNQLDDKSVALQYFYISANNNQPSEKHRLDFADDDSTYSRLHGNYHHIIRNYLEAFGYYDIFLVDSDSGDIVYSVFKELDFSTSLKDGLYANTNLGRVFREVNDSNKQNYTRLIDFEPYPPSYEAATSFIASPIFDGSEKIGVLIFQMPIDRINTVMTSNNDWESVGLGESGETYLIGNDFTMRNQSRFIIEDRESYFEQVARFGMRQSLLNAIKAKESTILLQKIESKGTKAALSGETGIEIFPDYRNVLVLSAYAPLDIDDVEWAIMSEIDKEEALRPVMKLRNRILKIGGSLGIFGILAIFLSMRITKPIKKLTDATIRIGKGDRNVKLEINTKDEIGELAYAFNKMTTGLREVTASRDELDKEITERKQVENALKESEQKTLLLLNSAGEGIYGLDLEGNCTFCNPSCLCLLGYEDESQLLSRNMHALIHHTRKDGTPYPEEECCIYQAFRAGKGIHVENEVFWRADGTSFATEYRSFPIFQEGKTVGSAVSFVDITERKEIEDALMKSEEKYRKLMETAQDAILCDINGIITDWNKSAEGLFGYSRDEIIGKNINILVPEEYKKEHQEGLERFIKTGEGRMIGKTIEVSAITKEGAEIPIEMSLTAQKLEEGQYSFMAIIRDLTERKKIQESLLQSEKLKSLGTITAGVAHDFNNILAIISGNVQLLEGTYKDHEKLTKALRIIKRATNDGADISKRMLQFTKTDKGTSGFVPFDINELINQAIDFTMPSWKNMAQAKGINYCMDTEGMKMVPSILCNPAELREVFVNIINNALDAMPDDGRITFRTWSEEGTIFMSISDTGIGMSDEVKRNIFDPFFTTKRAEGTGLGMSTTYGIITGHGGKIEVESAVGKGSTFNLQFPSADKADSTEESPETKQEIKANSLRILVVDDEEEIYNILDKFFSEKGHLVRTVDSGQEAIILAKAVDYDLVLCDMVMPEVYGYDVIKALNKLANRPKIGIITGWGEKLKPLDDEGLKVDFIIKKPFDFSELTKQVNDLFI